MKPGDPSKSELVRRITTDDTDDMMPPPESPVQASEEKRPASARPVPWLLLAALFLAIALSLLLLYGAR